MVKIKVSGLTTILDTVQNLTRSEKLDEIIKQEFDTFVVEMTIGNPGTLYGLANTSISIQEIEKRIKEMSTTRKLIETLTEQWYYEGRGCDAYCFFCGEWQLDTSDPEHEKNCPYILARKFILNGLS